MAAANPFERLRQDLSVDGKDYKFFSLPALNDPRVNRLPYSVRILLESAIRNCDEFTIKSSDVENILNWEQTSKTPTEVAFMPARVILQDFTGVPAVVDLAAMRDAVQKLGANPDKINPLVPVDLVVDHSVQVDKSGSPDSLEFNLNKEFERNKERFLFLKWGAKSFENLQIVPPGAGIVHQVNLEYLARSVFNKDGVLYPDSLVGTDSHTPMINGLGIVGWGVGGIEAEAVMLGQPISMVLPEVIGYRLTGELSPHATATDLVLSVVKNLRQRGVVEKFVEFFGPGVGKLSVADRATISNMAPEYGATIGFFAPDAKSIDYLTMTGRSADQLAYIESYFKAQSLFRNYEDDGEVVYTDVLHLDLSTIVPCLAGPKRPHDYVALTNVKSDFVKALTSPLGFKGFGLKEEVRDQQVDISLDGEDFKLHNGSVVIAAITSCTNTSNPSVMIAAGLLAKKAVEKGLKVPKYVKTSLAPGSGVVTEYLQRSGLLPSLESLGFNVVGYGCTTCIGNSGPLADEVAQAIEKADLVCAGVLSGNRNFEGRIHPNARANYLASPPLVVAYALASTVLIDFESEPLGTSSIDGSPVFLRDIWPTHEEVNSLIQAHVLPQFFTETYRSVTQGTAQWNSLEAPTTQLYVWDAESTYIHHPPFFQGMTAEPQPITSIDNARCLLNFGDSITTDHISPAGNISVKSPAARYLIDRGVDRKDFNSYGARRGNDEVMARGTFANIRLFNKLVGEQSPKTVHVPSGETLDVYDAAARYISEGTPLIILAGEQYGSGSSRDWAAKGVWMQNVKAVIAKSYERIHRSNLVLFGVMPLEFKAGQDADSLGLTGRETFSFLLESLSPGADVRVTVHGNDKVSEFVATLRIDTESEITYYKHGGVLNYVIRKTLSAN
mmetsp:Transcript_30818/g.51947  ORF Transcript_30818/g.51947 Transcript_30818/m.51947 type:complete len:896 (-) Transcript_30818:33-2720(-)|eukprot:CAMPEP_0184335720 /NCGR_PEP_ID=MMETSP1089-20130417/4243_1 /TAXON_ID=38269 ORGANISM="Gloeochaete wittrockiana, Strain SAG46.84" /NCGR_SAMPLE_ID=MMETSP1089 /ASSEMBLY_ACC=CAM_ASM_000445 /LENGTH=895 /DNA_ID=CAMNT_0026660533 /DNA_START=47 /DNA_END=2734 /DNA_ORIENTATION=+